MLSKEGRSIRRLAQVEGERKYFSIQRKVKSDSDICYKIVNENWMTLPEILLKQ